MKLFLSALVLVFLFSGCASNKGVQGQAHSITALDAENFKVLEERQSVGATIASQDRIAWIASDSLVKSIDPSALDKLEGYVAQGDLQDGYAVFYGYQNDRFFQVARIDFINGRLTKDLSEKNIVDDRLLALVEANHSANQFFNRFTDKLNIVYNSYIMERDSGYTVYFMPGSTNEYLVFGGCFKLSSNDVQDWKIEKLHNGPVAMKFDKVKQSNLLMRTSSMDKLPSETDYAQFHITKEWAPVQYIQTDSYLFLLKYDKTTGFTNSMMVK